MSTDLEVLQILQGNFEEMEKITQAFERSLERCEVILKILREREESRMQKTEFDRDRLISQ